MHSKGTSGAQPSVARKLTATQNRVGDCVYCEGCGLGIRRARVEHLRLFTAKQNLLLQQISNLWEGKDVPNPHLLQDCKHSIQQGSSAEQAGHTQESPTRCVSTGERQEEKHQKGPFCTSFRETKYTDSKGPIPLRPARQGDKKSSRAKESQGSSSPQLTHRAAFSIKQRRADPLTWIGPSLEMDS